jgi:hypothetical protein
MTSSKPPLSAGLAGAAFISSMFQLLLAICAAAGPAKLRFSNRLVGKDTLFPTAGPGGGPIFSTIPDGCVWKREQMLFFKKWHFLVLPGFPWCDHAG